MNRNYIPDCDLVNPALNGECGAMANQNFGKTIVTNHFASDVIGGNRPYNWATSVGIQQELRQGVAVSFGYFRTAWHNFSVADNQDQTAADFSPYCVTLPDDPLVPNAGQQLCGLDHVNPDKFGINRNVLVRQLSGIGSDASDVYTGIDITTNARLGHGAFVQGGMSSGDDITTRAPWSTIRRRRRRWSSTRPPGSRCRRPRPPTSICTVSAKSRRRSSCPSGNSPAAIRCRSTGCR